MRLVLVHMVIMLLPSHMMAHHLVVQPCLSRFQLLNLQADLDGQREVLQPAISACLHHVTREVGQSACSGEGERSVGGARRACAP